MHEFGIPGKLVRLTQVTMQQTEAQVKVDSQLTEPINITRGLKPVSYTHLDVYKRQVHALHLVLLIVFKPETENILADSLLFYGRSNIGS